MCDNLKLTEKKCDYSICYASLSRCPHAFQLIDKGNIFQFTIKTGIERAVLNEAKIQIMHRN